MARANRVTNRRLPVLAAALALAGCSSGDGSDASACEVAAALPAGGITAVDASATPRASRGAEILALEASGEFVAPAAQYERVVQDLETLGMPATGVTGCGVQPNQLLVGMTDAGRQQVENGQYTAWNDYNETLHVTEVVPRSEGYLLKFSGIYNSTTLAQAYAKLPEIRFAEPNGIIGASSDACVEPLEDAGQTNLYIFWGGSGDCQAGCISSSYSGFKVTAQGGVVALGSYDGSGVAPEWYQSAGRCRAFLYR